MCLFGDITSVGFSVKLPETTLANERDEIQTRTTFAVIMVLSELYCDHLKYNIELALLFSMKFRCGV